MSKIATQICLPIFGGLICVSGGSVLKELGCYYAKYLASESKNMNSQPAWIDYGNYEDFVPQRVKNRGNASFAKMPSGSIGRVYISATAATTWKYD